MIATFTFVLTNRFAFPDAAAAAVVDFATRVEEDVVPDFTAEVPPNALLVLSPAVASSFLLFSDAVLLSTATLVGLPGKDLVSSGDDG